ncbi:MAG: NAD(P)-dependent oxidoreductase [Burkholderiaceae bacterium]
MSAQAFPVAVIGVGNMGAAMAQNLLAQGWVVHVHDIVPERHEALVGAGARAHATAAEAATQAGTTVIAVVSAEQAHAVLFGTGEVARTVRLGHTVLLCPTMAPQAVEHIAAQLYPLGVFCVDAPMSGGPVRARAGSMSLMVACPEAVFVRQAPLLHALSSKVFRISERAGDGARTKLVNNLAAAINLAGAAEVLAMAQRMGLDGGKTLDVIEQSSGQSWIGSDRMRRALAQDYAPRAHMTLLEKDTRLAVQASLDAGFAGLLGSSVRDAFAAASASGLAELDDSALLRWMAERH